MYKLWAIKDIRKVIDEIEKILEYPCDLKIEISNRATKRMGAFFYKKEKGLIVPIKFVFAKRLTLKYGGLVHTLTPKLEVVS